jgi:uncharacterized membrane protein
MQAPEPEAIAAVQREFVLKRNCSLSPQGLMAVFGSLVVLALSFGVVFAVLGAWLILPFAGLELLALAAAFLVYGAHATDCERIRLAGEVLTVEVVEGRAVREVNFPAAQVRIRVEEARRARRIYLVHQGRELEVGRFLGAHGRAGFERDLRAALA